MDSQMTISDSGGDEFGLDSSSDADLLELAAVLERNNAVVNSGTDEFGFDSSDEADLVKVASSFDVINREPSHGTKRTALDYADLPPNKRLSDGLGGDSVPSYAIAALKSVFKLEGFRLKQGQVISRILAGNSAAVIFPTGGGKSLCYQIPALVFSDLDKLNQDRSERESGITLVVSPLLALMKDQVDALLRHGIKAASLDSSKSTEQYRQVCEDLRNGTLKILYCAPEKLNNERFVAQMTNVRGGIRLLAVDEAHCISEWGHAFRPDYLKIARFCKEIHAERVICLTATATPRVAQDICQAFGIDETAGIFRTSTYRPNLKLLAESSSSKQDLFPRLFQLLKRNPGSSIVYVTLKQQTELLRADLESQGFAVRAYHAGLGSKEKEKIQEEFMNSEDLIIVATIAFGMGIDKSSIRNVVHFNIPSSLESYSQEIGRAGRDGKPSTCVFYLSADDIYLREIFARGDLPSLESISRLLDEIFNARHALLPVGSELSFSHYTQENEYDLRTTTLQNIYAQLEIRYGYLRATNLIYSQYSYKPGSSYDKVITQDKSPEARAVLKYGQKKQTLYHIDVNMAVKDGSVKRFEIIRKLNEMHDEGTIDLRVSGVLNVYQVCKPLPKSRLDIIKLAKELYILMQDREEMNMARTDAMLNLVTSKACFSKSLSQHFGHGLPDGKQHCGHCNWCLTKRQVYLPQKIPPAFNYSAFNRILKEVPARDDARFLARIAFGIYSPRVKAIKLKRGNSSVFESMRDHEFMVLLRAFERECSNANQETPASLAPRPRALPPGQA